MGQRFTAVASHVITLLTACMVAAQANQDAKKPTKNRRYADGPLVAADFAGKAPQQLPTSLGIEIVASTQCEIRFDYRSAVEQRGTDLWTARITSFTCTAVIVPAKCWNTRPESRRVLDHEQGHFDVAEIAARRAQKHFTSVLRDRNAMTTGSDQRAAQRKLDQEIKKAMQEVYDGLAKAQKTYDEETRHGTAIVVQARYREWQRAELENLAKVK